MEREKNSRKFSKDEENFVLRARIVDLLIFVFAIFKFTLSGGGGVWGDGLGVCVCREKECRR